MSAHEGYYGDDSAAKLDDALCHSGGIYQPVLGQHDAPYELLKRRVESLEMFRRVAQDQLAAQQEQIRLLREGFAEHAKEASNLMHDAERYRWLRSAGAWESEIELDEMSKNPASFDAAVDSRMNKGKV